MQDVHDFRAFEYTTSSTSRRVLWGWILSALCVCLTALGLVGYIRISLLPPEDFPVAMDVVIAEGMTVSEIADMLAAEHVVRSALVFYLYMEYAHEGNFIQAGIYQFDLPVSVQELARALTEGKAISPALKVTFPEGFTAKEFSQYLIETPIRTESDDVTQFEGYLFPDTYFVSKDMSLHNLVEIMRENYVTKTSPLHDRIAASGFTEHDIITLASILEREANDPESMRMVAGILKNRLEIDMPLQVDATFEYILGKSSAELTPEDLELDSPYNTYIYTGLPPTPIANPGLEAITAVLEATSSPYMYYLTGNDGKFYYAQTFEEHKQNKARYLR